MYTRIIFVSRLSAIGDVIIAARALHLLKLNGYYPVFITSKLTKQIAELMPCLNSFICAEKLQETQFFQDKKEVKKEEFTHYISSLPAEKPPLFLDLQKTSRSKRALKEIKKFIKLDKVYYVPKRTFYRIFLIVIAFLCMNQKKRKNDLNMKSLQTIKNLQEELIKKIVVFDGKEFVDDQNYEKLICINTSEENTFHLENYICLFPGASGFIKMWPKENFRDLITLILEKTEFNVVLCGSHAELKIGDFLDFPENKRVTNLIDKTNLQQTFDIIAKSKYVVSNDSFAAHAAEVFSIPATVLFGATSPKFGFAPEVENIKIEYLNLACSPCTRHGKSECHFENLKCLRDITAQSVFSNILAKI